ncbi:MAG: hypothetical protein FJZ00_02130 [Candidatus Sericytochromatia bacterium]|uniref:Uncharacterized protein n=1 Tax=Candidatus Tanganyikabacteria bacterium TaxID=2961651 RepID=A0A937X0Z2_9BACT|nr:hypothetical protein [Candidatus Tanganyikabacteria bacterium]
MRYGRLCWTLVPVIAACAVEGIGPGTGISGRNTGKSPTPAPQNSGASASPGGSGIPVASASPIANPSGSTSPSPSGSGATTGGLDTGTSRNPTATPLASVTPVPAASVPNLGDTDGNPIAYAATTGNLAFAAPNRGYVLLAGDKLGEFPSFDPLTGPFTYQAGVTGASKVAPDGSGGVWVAGTSEVVRLSGGMLTAGTRGKVGFPAAALAADAQRVWIAGPEGQGLALQVSDGSTASVAFADKPVLLTADGNGGVLAIDSTGKARHYPAPGQTTPGTFSLGGQVAAVDIGDPGSAGLPGSLWAIVKGATPSVTHFSITAASSVDLGAGETLYSVSRSAIGKAWVLTDKALYRIETGPAGLTRSRFARSETWIPGGLAVDPGDPNKVFASDPVGKAVRRLYTGS